MKCPNCQFANREGAKFCGKCGHNFEVICQECGTKNRSENNFCNECGCNLQPDLELLDKVSKAESQSFPPSSEKTSSAVSPIAGERKHVTVLFSDLTGYTAMSELLDPEKVKEITTQIFDQISKIISKYDGFVEKYAGDAVMALFGAEKAHEDDPVRAIRAAREIHNLVNYLSPQFEEIIEQPLSMHTGINTGLVVTGEVDLEKGTHGVAGDTINVAARLSGLGKADDILAGLDTYNQAEGYFDFDELESAQIKGKSKPVRIFKVLTPKDIPIKIHRLHGLRAELVGRKVEMSQLSDAVERLKEGSGTIFSIAGPAGTGKSRLVKEFKEGLNLAEIQWLEGHAYPYTQNIPYYPLINLLSRALRIEEGDPPEKVREKIESGSSDLIGEHDEYIAYIGSLFSLSYPEIEEVSPEYWQDQLQKAIQAILSALAQQGPTIIRLEDLHWADPSFLELIRLLLTEFREPVLFLCIYRPVISLFTSHQIRSMANPYQEILLQDLSPSDSQVMVESLLKTTTIPSDLKRFIQDKVEGNPFYIEEAINSLIESETLIRDNGGWKVNRAIGEFDISSTIHGVISGRLDRLEKETKRILQEASVIGRAFLYDILKKITGLKDQVDRSLQGLERLDLIRTRSLRPELEYIFKHALTQEVVYNGLLKKERKAIHERIGLVMEQLFHDRLPEFYETLAFHFAQGKSALKAVDYLMKSGEKSLKRYAVEESHRYFKQAYGIISNKPSRTREEQGILIDLIISWAFVFYYRGDVNGMKILFNRHESDALSLDNKARLGMFNAWIGFSSWCQGSKLEKAYQYLLSALKLGEESNDQKVVGYAGAWLTWVCAELGRLDEAITYGKRAREIARYFPSDQYLNFKPVAGIAFTYWTKGEAKKAFEYGKTNLHYGKKHSNVRSTVLGHYGIGWNHLIIGDYASAVESFSKATQVAKDPFYAHVSRTLLGGSYLLNGQYHDAEDILKDTAVFCHKFGVEMNGTWSDLYLGLVSISKGQMSQGLNMIKEARRVFLENQRKAAYITAEYIIGKIYFQLASGPGPQSISVLVRNIGFIAKNFPVAGKKAETHLTNAIDMATKIGAQSILGEAYLDLGLLHKAKKRTEQAKECISKAIDYFEKCEAEVYLKQAKEAFESLE
jgi:class 3 adenylate cyclase